MYQAFSKNISSTWICNSIRWWFEKVCPNIMNFLFVFAEKVCHNIIIFRHEVFLFCPIVIYHPSGTALEEPGSRGLTSRWPWLGELGGIVATTWALRNRVRTFLGKPSQGIWKGKQTKQRQHQGRLTRLPKSSQVNWYATQAERMSMTFATRKKPDFP